MPIFDLQVDLVWVLVVLAIIALILFIVRGFPWR